MSTDQFPPGWSEERVRKVIEHYGSQTDDEAIAEDEARLEEDADAVMKIPRELVPAVRELIWRRKWSD